MFCCQRSCAKLHSIVTVSTANYSARLLDGSINRYWQDDRGQSAKTRILLHCSFAVAGVIACFHTLRAACRKAPLMNQTKEIAEPPTWRILHSRSRTRCLFLWSGWRCFGRAFLGCQFRKSFSNLLVDFVFFRNLSAFIGLWPAWFSRSAFFRIGAPSFVRFLIVALCCFSAWCLLICARFFLNPPSHAI